MYTVHVRVFGREITKYTVIYGVCTRVCVCVCVCV